MLMVLINLIVCFCVWFGDSGRWVWIVLISCVLIVCSGFSEVSGF